MTPYVFALLVGPLLAMTLAFLLNGDWRRGGLWGALTGAALFGWAVT